MHGLLTGEDRTEHHYEKSHQEDIECQGENQTQKISAQKYPELHWFPVGRLLSKDPPEKISIALVVWQNIFNQSGSVVTSRSIPKGNMDKKGRFMPERPGILVTESLDDIMARMASDFSTEIAVLRDIPVPAPKKRIRRGPRWRTVLLLMQDFSCLVVLESNHRKENFFYIGNDVWRLKTACGNGRGEMRRFSIVSKAKSSAMAWLRSTVCGGHDESWNNSGTETNPESEKIDRSALDNPHICIIAKRLGRDLADAGGIVARTPCVRKPRNIEISIKREVRGYPDNNNKKRNKKKNENRKALQRKKKNDKYNENNIYENQNHDMSFSSRLFDEEDPVVLGRSDSQSPWKVIKDTCGKRLTVSRKAGFSGMWAGSFNGPTFSWPKIAPWKWEPEQDKALYEKIRNGPPGWRGGEILLETTTNASKGRIVSINGKEPSEKDRAWLDSLGGAPFGQSLSEHGDIKKRKWIAEIIRIEK